MNQLPAVLGLIAMATFFIAVIGVLVYLAIDIDRSYNKKKNVSCGLKWQELMCRIEGPVVASIDLVFATARRRTSCTRSTSASTTSWR